MQQRINSIQAATWPVRMLLRAKTKLVEAVLQHHAFSGDTETHSCPQKYSRMQ